MKEIILKNYVKLDEDNDKEDNHYLDPSIIEVIVADCLELNISFKDIYELVKTSQITTTSKELEQQLKQKMNIERPGLEEAFKYYQKLQHVIDDLTNRINYETKLHYLILQQELKKYLFNSELFKYYQTYIATLKEKCLSLFKLYNSLYEISRGEKVKRDIIEQINRFDFHFNNERNLYDEDVIRLASTMVYNINDLIEKLSQAQNTDSYICYNFTEKDLCNNGLSPYPTLEIQRLDEFCDNPQYLPYTKKQQKYMMKKN